MLHLENIAKSYSEITALKGVSFQLKAGEVVGLLGPNGAGKSTLMKIITGYLTDWEGSIHYGEKNVRTDLKSIQQVTGYLPENNPLYPDLYVLEYLKFIAGLYRIKNAPFETVIEKVGLSEVRNRKINTLSKGYQQRMGLAAALLHDPEIVILDEPTTGLDPNQLIEIRKLIRQLGETKIVLLSTHILSEVESVCDRVIIIRKGEVVADEDLQTLRKGQQQIIQVEFDFRVETEALNRIEGVTKVVNTFDFSYELYCNNKEDLRPKVFDFAHDNQLKILSLNQKNENLAELFNTLTA
ncbi:MAG: ATP-binding cassette domain-containing protein [Flavobacteriaceae bacterium]